LATGHTEERFAAEPHRYARVRISQCVVPAEGLARELLARIQDDGAEFAELARQHGQPGSGVEQSGAVVLRAQLPASVAEVVFQARPDSVVGPVATPQGWHLFHVHELLPPRLDEPARAWIRQELFDGWLRKRLADVRIDVSGLDQI
jgi:parvulin-like peptidyl-prolyl isomerase